MGSLVGFFDSSSATVTLTTIGTTDWIHWVDLTTTQRKSGGGSSISFARAEATTEVTTAYSGDPRTVSWTDGSPTASGSDTAGIYVNRSGGNVIASGFQLTAPAGTLTRQLICYFGYFNVSATMTAHLSDSSAPDYTDNAPTVGSVSTDRNYTFTYRTNAAEGTGATITITWVNAVTGGNVTINGATLALLPGPTPGSVPSGTALTVPAFTPKFLFFDTGDYSPGI